MRVFKPDDGEDGNVVFEFESSNFGGLRASTSAPPETNELGARVVIVTGKTQHMRSYLSEEKYAIRLFNSFKFSGVDVNCQLLWIVNFTAVGCFSRDGIPSFCQPDAFEAEENVGGVRASIGVLLDRVGHGGGQRDVHHHRLGGADRGKTVWYASDLANRKERPPPKFANSQHVHHHRRGGHGRGKAVR